MSICENMKSLTPKIWETIHQIIEYHGDPSALNWILDELKNNKSWHLIYDYFGHNDNKWYLLPNDKSWTIACDVSKESLMELAQQYGKEVDIEEESSHE